MFEYAVKKAQKDETFGIEIFEDGTKLRTFEDISPIELRINKFADLCNNLQISPIHFDDVLENFLTDFESL